MDFRAIICYCTRQCFHCADRRQGAESTAMERDELATECAHTVLVIKASESFGLILKTKIIDNANISSASNKPIDNAEHL